MFSTQLPENTIEIRMTIVSAIASYLCINKSYDFNIILNGIELDTALADSLGPKEELPVDLPGLRTAIIRATLSYLSVDSKLEPSFILDEDKIDSALAEYLGVEVCKVNPTKEPYTISFDYNFDTHIIINHTRISTSLIRKNIIQHTVYDRKIAIKNIKSLIKDTNISEVYTITEYCKSLSTLLKSNAYDILCRPDFTGCVAPDTSPVQFNAVCDDIINDYEEYMAT